MSVVIKGMDMPTEGEAVVLVISNENGKTLAEVDEYCGAVYEAVSVPPHGRLGDLDAAVELAMQYCPDDDGSCSKAGSDLRELLDEIESLPTIIPAESED